MSKPEMLEDLKVGDSVRVVDEDTLWKCLPLYARDQFDKRKVFCGKVVKLSEISDKRGDWFYTFEESEYNWTKKMIQKVENSEQPSQVHKFEIGDVVRVIRNTDEPDLKCLNMDKVVGKTGTVVALGSLRRDRVELEFSELSRFLWFSHTQLEPVEPVQSEKLENIKEEKSMEELNEFEDLIKKISNKLEEIQTSTDEKINSKMSSYLKKEELSDFLVEIFQNLKIDLDKRFTLSQEFKDELEKKVSKKEIVEILEDLEKTVVSKEGFSKSLEVLEKTVSKILEDLKLELIQILEESKKSDIQRLEKLLNNSILEENKELRKKLELIEERLKNLENPEKCEPEKSSEVEKVEQFHSFKIGDVVKVVKNTEEDDLKCLDMDKVVGKTGTVVRLGTAKKDRVKLKFTEPKTNLWFSHTQLEPVEDEQPSQVDSFKVGDVVKVVKRVEEKINWINKMEKTVGMVGKVIRCNGGGCRVKFENEERWWYDSECLELQKSEPVQPAKVEKTEKVVSDVEIIKILRKCLDLK